MAKTDAVYCPGIDPEMRDALDSIIMSGLAGAEFEGGGGGLGGVGPQSTLYLLCHGHAKMPMFTTKKGSWSGQEMAGLLEADGLRKDHRSIEMLVCHAGESVTDTGAAKKRLAIRDDFKKAGSEKTKAKLQTKFAEVPGQAPGEFTSSNQVLPMCAQLIQGLKTAGYNYIRVIAYACPVAIYFAGGVVHLDLSGRGGHFGVPATDHPKLRKLWL